MSQSALENFGEYQKARQLFDFVVADMERLRQTRFATDLCHNKWAAQIRSVQTSKRVMVD
jgi:hypothetical protein